MRILHLIGGSVVQDLNRQYQQVSPLVYLLSEMWPVQIWMRMLEALYVSLLPLIILRNVSDGVVASSIAIFAL